MESTNSKKMLARALSLVLSPLIRAGGTARKLARNPLLEPAESSTHSTGFSVFTRWHHNAKKQEGPAMFPTSAGQRLGRACEALKPTPNNDARRKPVSWASSPFVLPGNRANYIAATQLPSPLSKSSSVAYPFSG